MAVNKEAYQNIKTFLDSKDITLVAVSKTKPVEDILELYELGQRDFGENYVQEMIDKQVQLPKDIRWHFIGHLQTNKVKYIAPFVHLIHGVDSLKLMKEINKEAVKHNRIINVLLQVYIAQEETKFGLDEKDLEELLNTNGSELNKLNHVKICGMMGMASFTNDLKKVRAEFHYLKTLFDQYQILSTFNFQLSILSIGMSADYQIAIEEGSTMVRIGSLLFGERK